MTGPALEPRQAARRGWTARLRLAQVRCRPWWSLLKGALECLAVGLLVVGLFVAQGQWDAMRVANDEGRLARMVATSEARRALHLQMRPWVLFVEGSISAQWSLAKGTPSITYQMKNDGPSPALYVRARTSIAAVPEAPDVASLKPIDMAVATTPLTALPPGAGHTASAEFVGDDGPKVTALAAKNASGTHWLYVRGEITYETPTGAAGATRFCVALPPGTIKVDTDSTSGEIHVSRAVHCPFDNLAK